MATATELLLPALLAMDVYHRDVEGALFPLVNGTPLPDGVTPFGETANKTEVGFVAKAYEYKNTIYIAYRGADDGSPSPAPWQAARPPRQMMAARA